jgi:hypothetical protein
MMHRILSALVDITGETGIDSTIKAICVETHSSRRCNNTFFCGHRASLAFEQAIGPNQP